MPTDCSNLRRIARGLLTLIVLAAIAGCVSGPGLSPEARPQATIELAETPFHPQEAYQCGPAALATVLQASAVDTDPDALVDQVWLPGREGSLQVELVAATRRHGRIAYVLPPHPDALIAELQAGYPVLVFQNLGTGLLPAWHFAVVIGFDPERNQVILRSGTTERETLSLNAFLRTWALADNWAMVALKPGQLPGSANARNYLAAVTDLEQTGQLLAASQGYQTWLNADPDNRVAWFGLGNSLAAMGAWQDARVAYQQLVRLAPDDGPALHNLARAQLHLGCVAAARELGLRGQQLADQSERLGQAFEVLLADIATTDSDDCQ